MARAKFGGVTQIKESLRDQMGFPMLESIVHDARYAVRGPAGGRCARCRSRIIAGRPFTESDVSGAQRVVLISQRLAETWWPDETAVGQRIALPGSERDTDPWRTVVGVVADVRWQGPASEGTTLYLPLAQHVGAIDAMTLIVQSSGDTTLVADGLRAAATSAWPPTRREPTRRNREPAKQQSGSRRNRQRFAPAGGHLPGEPPCWPYCTRGGGGYAFE